MEMKRSNFQSLEFKVMDETQGIAEMIVAVFNNVDTGNDLMMPEFFAESLVARRTGDGRPRVKGVWSHDWSIPIAKTLDAAVLLPFDLRLPESIKSLGGLWIKAQFNLDTQRGREAFSDLKFGTIDEFSVGYTVEQESYDNQTGVRTLVKGTLYEWSPILVGMNPATVLVSTKGENLTDAKSLPLADHDILAQAAIRDVVGRYKSLADLNTKEGRAISQARRDRMMALRDTMDSVMREIDTILSEADAPQKGIDATSLFLEYQKILTAQNSANI